MVNLYGSCRPDITVWLEVLSTAPQAFSCRFLQVTAGSYACTGRDDSFDRHPRSNLLGVVLGSTPLRLKLDATPGGAVIGSGLQCAVGTVLGVVPACSTAHPDA